jgi:glycosyltransferase involved in cell wall biosynthesis
MTTFAKMKIGILIPTFNRCSYLADALRSAREQTHQNIEMIVIDNGSADGTTAFMESVSDPRVRHVINEANIGMIGSINKGMGLFSEEVTWCTILGDDDLLDKDFIMTLLCSANDSKAKSIIHSHRIFIDQRGNKIREATVSPREETAFDYMKSRAYAKRETYLTGVLFNREAFDGIGGYPSFSTGLASDDAFIFALALKDRLVFGQSAIAYIRIHEGAESVHYSNGMRKLETVRQFGEYCEKVARQNGNHSQEQFRAFGGTFKKYLRRLYSHCWIQAAHCAMNQENEVPLVELLHRVNRNWDDFSFRVRFAVACHNIAGIFPEGSRAYRTCWANIFNASQLIRGKAPLLPRKRGSDEAIRGGS